jgi:hypothetical protein
MISKQIIKSCLRNVIRACKRYGVSFNKILTEILSEQARGKK